MNKCFQRKAGGSAACLMWLAFLLVASCDKPVPPTALKLAVSSSYLECAARDLLGEQVEFVRLAEPGACPGHFDLRPSQITELRDCRALLRFNFQDSLDAKLTNLTGPHRPIVEITLCGGMCEASSYLTACRQLAEAFVAAQLLSREGAAARYNQIAERVNACAAKLQADVKEAGLQQLPVITSGHQRAFCEALGLHVVGTFRASDASRISEINHLIEVAQAAGVKLVVANRPEGRRLADALAERLSVKMVEFGNFPDPRTGETAFDALLAANTRALLDAAR